MILVSLLANVLGLIPVLLLLARDAPLAGRVLGPDGPARRVLAAIYATVLMASLFLLWRYLAADPRAPGWIEALLAGQVAYKLGTLVLIGPRSLLVQGNLALAALHLVTLLTL